MSNAVCIIPNCRRGAPSSEAFCSHHRDDGFPKPKRQEVPCGECRLPVGEVCDICGASQSGGEDIQEWKDALHDLVMLHSEEWAIGGGPGFKERSTKAWAVACDLVRVEP